MIAGVRVGSRGVVAHRVPTPSRRSRRWLSFDMV